MLLVSEQERGEVRVRVLACDECGPGEECGTRFLAFQAGHEQLWVCLAWTEDGDEADEALEAVFGKPSVMGDDVFGYVNAYTALAGLTWPVLVGNGQACRDQVQACAAMPPWMRRLNRELLWDTRRVVFGHDLTRVYRALWAAHQHYMPDAPALEPWGG